MYIRCGMIAIQLSILICHYITIRILNIGLLTNNSIIIQSYLSSKEK